MVGGEQPPDQAQRDPHGGGSEGGKDEEYDDGLNEHGLQGRCRPRPGAAVSHNTPDPRDAFGRPGDLAAPTPTGPVR